MDDSGETDKTGSYSNYHIRHRSFREICNLVDTFNQPHSVQLEKMLLVNFMHLWLSGCRKYVFGRLSTGQ